MASIFQRGNVYWILYYKDGQKISHSLKTKDKKIAAFKKNELENKLALGESPLANLNKSAKEAFEEFKQDRAGRIQERSALADHYRIERYLSDCNIVRLRSITESSLKSHLDKRIEERISMRTANHTIRAMGTFLNFCVRNKYLPENPISGMKKYPVHTEEPRFLNQQEISQLLEFAKDSKIYGMILTALYTGMRLGEIVRLEWQDVDFKANLIRVRIAKSKKFRNIPINERLAEYLKPIAGQGKCFPFETIFQVEWAFKKLRADLMEKTKMPYFHFHDLRHTFASMLIKSGVDILTVSKLLGHSSVVVTQIYAHLYEDHVQDAIKKLKF